MIVDIHHIIDQTSKEIYSFEKLGNTWYYIGIMYSNRNDSSDTWGDEWGEKYEKQKELEYDAVAKKYGYDSYSDVWNDFSVDSDVELVRKKYNPCCNKTKDGKTYYHGVSWGFNDNGGKGHPPKLTEDELKEKILKKISKIKIKL